MEPVVIDEEMLQRAVAEQIPAEYPESVKRDASDPAQIQSLRLDYRTILRIDHLSAFTKLTKLQLDNNMIEKIEHLDHLVHLEWLDLSFNRIKSISGLDALSRLTDLSLFGNQISLLEGLDAQRNSLEVLSVGKNDLKEMQQLHYLIPFAKLRVLNIAQNPFCEKEAKEDWRTFTLAHLRHLKYLNYRLIDPDDVRVARSEYKEAIQAIELRSAVVESETQQAITQQANQKKLDDAHIGTLPTLFRDMFAEDVGLKRLRRLDVAALAALEEEYAKVFAPIIQDISEHAITNKAARRAEIADVTRCLLDAYQSLDAEQRQATKDYFKAQKWTLAALDTSSLMSEDAEEASIASLRNKAQDLIEQLMHTDNALVEQVQAVLAEFDTAFSTLCQQAIKQGQEDFQRLEEADKRYQTQLTAVTSTAFEKVSVDQDSLNSSDADLREIANSRDVFNALLADTERQRRQRLRMAQDQLTQGIQTERETAVTEAQEKEASRHWHRVAEISVIQNNCQATLAEFATAA